MFHTNKCRIFVTLWLYVENIPMSAEIQKCYRNLCISYREKRMRIEVFTINWFQSGIVVSSSQSLYCLYVQAYI